MKRQRGFTLMELMISITLVAAISAGILMSMRTGLQTMQKVNDRLASDRRVLAMQQILQHQLSNAMPVAGLCDTGGAVFSFNGTEQTMHLVSSYSMSEGARGYPRVIELQVIGSSSGGLQLIANEAPYTGPGSTAQFCLGGGFGTGRAGPQSFVVADRLAYCRFAYKGVDPENPKGGAWGPEWTKSVLPSAARVEMAPLSGDAAHLPLLSVTARILITRDGTFNNNDYW
jgi:prepilin-type N-terminal cleavage/methylation domain-containing protein